MPGSGDDLFRLQRNGPDTSDGSRSDVRLMAKSQRPLDPQRQRHAGGQREQLFGTSRAALSPQLTEHRLAKLRPEIEIALVVQHICEQMLLFRSFHTLKT